MNEARLNWDFGYHEPDEDRLAKHVATRDKCWELASYINQNVPDCREKSLAITKIEEAMFWANAAIAREPRPGEVFE